MRNDSERRPSGRQIYVGATSFVALLTIVGFALYGLPLYYDFMVTEFGWSRTIVTSGNALSKLVVGPLFGFGAGWIVDRFGPRRLMIVGILMAGGALVGLAHVTSLWMFYLFYFFNALGYVCGGPLPNQVLISRWFTRSRGTAMGIVYLGIGVGGAVVPIITARLLPRLGWHGTLQAIGILIVALALPFAYFVREQPDGSARAANARAPMPPVGALFRSPAFYLLAGGSMCSIAAVGGANQHLKLYLSLDLHKTQSQSLEIASIVLGFSIAGRLLMGWLADKLPKKYVMFMIYVLIAASIPLLFAGRSSAALYGFAIAFGLGLGGEYLIIPLIAAELFGVEVLGRLLGVILTADGVAEGTAPMLVGYLRDRTGSYDVGFSLLIAVALVGAAAIVMLPRPSSHLESTHV